MNLGDIFFAFRGESRQLVADAKQAAEVSAAEASKTFGQRFKEGITKAGVGITAGFTAALSASTISRFAQLDRAVADFRRETGATAEEAQRAGQAINDMASRNLQPIEEIGRALTRVTTDWGLHGDAAASAADAVLKYARVTGQDAEAAVGGLDDVMDAWNLTAEDSTRIMDMLVASQQQYGGSIEDSERALRDLAPVFRSQNMDLDEGVQLLNLLKASGLDASKAQMALNTAVSRLPKGESLMRFLERLNATEDATERTNMALKVFGTRGGVGLANALDPARGALSDFAMGVDEYEGATDRAVEASMTFLDKVMQGFRGVTSEVVGFFGSNGEIIMAVSGLTNILGPTLAKAIAAVGGLAAVKAAATALGAGLGETAAGAMAAKMVQGLVASVGLGALSLPALLAAGVVVAIPAALVLNTASGDPIGQAIDDWVAKLTGKDLPLGPGEMSDRMRVARFQARPDEAWRAILGGLRLPAKPADVMARAREIAAQFGDVPWEDLLSEAVARSSRGGGPLLAVLDQMAREMSGQGAGGGAVDPLATAFANVELAGLKEAESRLARLLGQGGSGSVRGLMRAWVSAGSHEAPLDVREQFRPWVAAARHEAPRAMKEIGEAAAARAAGIPRRIAQAIADNGLGVRTAMDALKSILENGMTPNEQKQLARSKRWGKLFAQGLRSEIPGAKQSALEMAAEALAAMSDPKSSKKNARWIGRTIGRLYAAGFTDEEVRTALAAQGLSQKAIDRLMDKDRKKGARKKGREGVGAFREGLQPTDADKRGVESGGQDLVGAWAAGALAKAWVAYAKLVADDGPLAAIKAALGGSLPEEGPLVGAWEGGGDLAEAWTSRFVAGLANTRRAAERELRSVSDAMGVAIGAAMAPGFGSLTPALAVNTMATRTVRHEGTVEVRLSSDTIASARALGASWDDIARMGRIASAADAQRTWEDAF